MPARPSGARSPGTTTRPRGRWRAGRLVGVLLVTLGAQVVFLLLLVVGAAVPDRPIVDTLAAMPGEGRTWGLPEADGLGGTGTPTTDQAVLTTGLGTPEADAWDRAMLMPRLPAGSPGWEDVQTLADGGNVEIDRGYFRYWAGYSVLTRPVLALGGVEALRAVVMTLLVGAAAGTAAVLARTLGPLAACAVALPLVATTNLALTPSVSMSHALSTAVALTGVSGVVLAARYRRALVPVAAVLAGATYNFVDLLTNPVLPWMLAGALAVAVVGTTDGVRAGLASGLGVVALWPIGYAVTWVTRWAIAMTSLGPARAWDDIGAEVGYRLQGEHPAMTSGPLAATVTNIRSWWDTAPLALPVLLLTFASVVVLLAAAARRTVTSPTAPTPPERLVFAALVFAPAALVPIWYEVLSNHSQIHASFTSRYVPAVLSLLLLAAVMARAAPGSGTDAGLPDASAGEVRTAGWAR